MIVSSLDLNSSLVLIIGLVSLIHKASSVSRYGMLLVVVCKMLTSFLSVNKGEAPQSLMCFPNGWEG